MGEFRLPDRVEARIDAMLDAGVPAFGEDARDRYAALVVRAMQDVADDPRRSTARSEPGLDPSIKFYHLRLSRDRVPDPPGKVRNPRHVLVFREAADGVVNILGLIPDAIPRPVALPRFVPEEG